MEILGLSFEQLTGEGIVAVVGSAATRARKPRPVPVLTSVSAVGVSRFLRGKGFTPLTSARARQWGGIACKRGGLKGTACVVIHTGDAGEIDVRATAADVRKDLEGRGYVVTDYSDGWVSSQRATLTLFVSAPGA